MTRTPHVNSLLAALPRKVSLHFIGGCDKVELVFAEVLCEPGEPVRHVYFPTDGYISLVNKIDSHSSLEIALIGNEGMHGIAPMLGINVSQFHALVQGGGFALRMRAALFRRELLQNPALRRILNHYIFVRMSQLAQTAA